MTTFSAVRTTGIYCRPGCGARPRAENVITFEIAAAAEAAGYRACLRCRPYRLAAPIGATAPELVCRAVQQIIGGALDEGTEDALGRRLGVSGRHLRRLFTEHLGVTPTQLAYSRRAHFARRLLDDSDLTIAQVALASGFGSVRQFNRTMRDVFHASPRDLRARRRRYDRLVVDGGLALRIPVQPPYDWSGALRVLAARAIPGIEAVAGGSYRRTIVLDGEPGLLELEQGGADHIVLRTHLPYWEGLIHVVERASRMLGLDVDIDTAETALANDPLIGPIVRGQRGLRVHGAWGPFEMGVQVLIGELLGATPARTVLAAIVRSHGLHVPGLPAGLSYVFPSAETLADADLGACQLPAPAATIVKGFAAAVASDALRLEQTASLDQLIAALTAIPGVDRSCAQMIALRLGHHDAFPYADRQLRASLQQLGGSTDSTAAEAWRPWRAQAAAHLIAYATSRR